MSEGEKTECQYFKGLRNRIRATGTVVQGTAKIHGDGNDPLRVVSKAKELKLLEEKKGGGFDSVWCVVDVDKHATLDRAIVEAKRLGFRMAISNPCFEIWLLWHFADCQRSMEKNDLDRENKRHGFVDGKSIPNGFPYENLPDAIRRASRSGVGKPENPGSGVWVLAKELASGTRLTHL